MKEAFSTEVKCGFDRQKPFPICSAILIWSHDNILYIIDKLQNICLPSHAQPDLFHKEKRGSLQFEPDLRNALKTDDRTVQTLHVIVSQWANERKN